MSDDPAFVSEPPSQARNGAPTVFRAIRNTTQVLIPPQMQAMHDIEMTVSLELGRATLPLRDVLSLGQGAIIELDKQAGDPVDIVVNGQVVARGEVVVVDDRFAVRLTEVLVT
jgi:flagellar motor switch protein FliN/FliY